MRSARFRLRRLLRGALTAVPLAAAGWATAAGAGEPLQPWQMVRSLQLVQDRIADGDQAAIPMQRKLLEMIDARLRTATRAELADPRNWDAVMVYAMGGGNPATVKALMPDLLAAADAAAAKAAAEARAAAGEDTAETEQPEGAEGHGGEADESGHSAAAETPPSESPAAGHASPEPASADHGAAPHGEAGHEAPAHEADAHGETPAPETSDAHAAGSHTAAAGGEAASPGHGETVDAVTTHSIEASSHDAPKAKKEGAAGHGEGATEDGEEAASPPPQGRNLALGVFNYGRGREDYAGKALAGVDPLREKPELGAFVALIKGSLLARADPAGALKLFDQARLAAPGTLVEEAALRRSVSLAVATKDRARFLLGSGQYVRRFLRSPYAGQFADAFVAGVVALQEGLDLDEVSSVAAGMAPEQERVVFLRIARQAGIDNLMALSAFAANKAGAGPEELAAAQDPRAVLYSALSAVTGQNTTATLAQLDALDPGRLTASDRELLEAVKAVGAATLRPPAVLAALPPAPAGDGPATGNADPVEAGITGTREALADVDRLLEEK